MPINLPYNVSLMSFSFDLHPFKSVIFDKSKIAIAEKWDLKKIAWPHITQNKEKKGQSLEMYIKK